MKRNKRKSTIVKLTRETPEARKERASSGVKFRATVFENKKRKQREKYEKNDRYYDEQEQIR